MNGQSGPISVLSDGSEWSGYSKYASSGQPPHSPGLTTNRGNLVTPPISGSSNGTYMSNSGMIRRAGDPSPPNSIARSSYGTTLSSADHERRKRIQMEERLSQHYVILKRYLGQSLRDAQGNPKPNRARDKLTRLSPVQFQELSTDVYDELLRRQSAAGQQINGPGQVPPFLLPKENFHPKRNQARQKLATLPAPRFKDLATDVFYELERRFPVFGGSDIARSASPARSLGGSTLQGPPSRTGTPNGMRPNAPGHGPPPRNQSLSGQVMQGLGLPGVQEDPRGRPMAKTFQSNTIIPNKSTMVEDDDDENMSDVYGSRRDTTYTSRSGGHSEKDRRALADSEAQVNELQIRIKDLEEQVHDKDTELDKFHESQDEQMNSINSERGRWNALQSDLESKVRSARNLNENLQSELDKIRNDQASGERELRSQIDAIANRASGGGEWKSRYESLERSHQDLRAQLSKQEKVTNEVKQEAAGFLNQMKALSERGGQNFEREEQLVRRVHLLENEVNEWKSRYARARTQANTSRIVSISTSLQQPHAGGMIGEFTARDGLVKDLHVTQFQVAIDELLRSARDEKAQSILEHVKSVALVVRSITLDVGKTRLGQDGLTQQQSKLLAKISATANNLITAAKNLVMSHGLSPISLLDAAASHLASAVIELIKVVKMCPTPSRDFEEDDEHNTIGDSPADYYGISHGRGSGGDESIYSSMSSPQQARGFAPNGPSKGLKSISNGVHNGVPSIGSRLTQDDNLEHGDDKLAELKLKAFLDPRTNTLLSSIQTLVTLVRTSAPPPDILDTIQAITSTTSQIVQQTVSNVRAHSAGSRIARTLSDLVESLESAGREGEKVDTEQDWKDYVKQLPPLAFEIAREVKELGAWADEEVNGVDFG